MGVESKKQAEKHTSWVFEEKIKQKNTNRKLIEKFRSGNWVWRGKIKLKPHSGKRKKQH